MDFVKSMISGSDITKMLLEETILEQPCQLQQWQLSWLRNYDLNVCLFHPVKLELFQANSNKEWYVKCPFPRECGVFSSRNMQNAYMGVLNRKVHNTYRNLKGTVMCECNNQASLRVSESSLNPGRPFFGCRNRGGCRFFQWAGVGFTKKNEELQKLFKEYGKFWKLLFFNCK